MKRYISQLPKDKKFLLGFSGGVDSSALFFLLLESEVEFDLCIVDYALREQSVLEVAYAKQLAEQYQKKIHLLKAPKLSGNFESQARKIRYEFFGDLIRKYAYEGVILAHQLNDRLEWFLMQFLKGAGLNTLLGFNQIEKINDFWVFRPLLEVSKQELYAFCQKNSIMYFEDSSNQDEAFLRNKIRKLTLSLGNHSRGILQSFEFLQTQREHLFPPIDVLVLGDVRAFSKREKEQNLHVLDLEAKKMGYVFSKKQKEEILRCDFSCEIASLIIESDQGRIFIAPKIAFKPEMIFDSWYRDFARKNHIPKRLRKIIFFSLIQERIHLEQVCDFFVSKGGN